MGNENSSPAVERFRKRPVVVEAVHFLGETSAAFISGWAHPAAIEYVPRGCEHTARYVHETDSSTGYVLDTAPEYLVIPTLEGDHRADLGDWIIRGVAGELYPCKEEIFAETYEAEQ